MAATNSVGFSISNAPFPGWKAHLVPQAMAHETLLASLHTASARQRQACPSLDALLSGRGHPPRLVPCPRRQARHLPASPEAPRPSHVTAGSRPAGSKMTATPSPTLAPRAVSSRRVRLTLVSLQTSTVTLASRQPLRAATDQRTDPGGRQMTRRNTGSFSYTRYGISITIWSLTICGGSPLPHQHPGRGESSVG